MKCPRCNQPLSRAEVSRLFSSLKDPAKDPTRKLSNVEKAAIRRRKDFERAADLAKEYGVSESLIYKVWQKKR